MGIPAQFSVDLSDTPPPSASSTTKVAKTSLGADTSAGIGSAVANSAKYVANEAAKSFWGFVDNAMDFGKSQMVGEPMSNSAARLIGLPSFLVEAMPGSRLEEYENYLRQKKIEDAATAYQKARGNTRGFNPDTAVPKDEPLSSKLANPEMESPGPISSFLGLTASGMADPRNWVLGPENAFAGMAKASLEKQAARTFAEKAADSALAAGNFTGTAVGKPPVAGSMTTLKPFLYNAATGGAATDVGDVTGTVGGKLGELAMGDEGKQFGSVAGNVLGGVAGSNLRVAQLDALKTVTKRPLEALKAAKLARDAGDTRNLATIYADQWGDLSAEQRNFVQDRAAEKLASAIRNDPHAQASWNELKDAQAKLHEAGVIPEGESIQMNLPQSATTPSLVREAVDRIAGSQAESQQWIDQSRQSTSLLSRIWSLIHGKAVDVPPTQTAAESLDNYRKRTNEAIEAKANSAQQVRDSITNWDPPAQAAAGAQLRDLRTQVRGTPDQPGVAATRDENYMLALQHPEAPTYDSRPLAKALETTIGSTLSEIDPKTLPPAAKRIYDLVAPTQTAGGGVVNPKLSLADLHDINTTLNRDITRASMATDLAASDRAAQGTALKQSVQDLIHTQADNPAVKLYDAAQKFHGEVYSPMFKTGANATIGQKAANNTPKVLNENVINEYLKGAENGKPSETAMQNFDNLFGGKLTGQPVPQAYELLAKQIESDYSKQVLSKPLNAEAHDKFLSDYAAPLARLSDTEDKLNSTFDNLARLAHESATIREGYESVVGKNTLGAVFGPDSAAGLIMHSLSNPENAKSLIDAVRKESGEQGVKALIEHTFQYMNPKTGNEYDPRKIFQIMNAGTTGPGSVGGLETMFRAAYGNVEGSEHFDRLKAIATLMDRQAMTEPKYLRPTSPEGSQPVKEATGQSFGSWLALAKNVIEGRASTAYFAGISGGRYFAQFFSKQLREANNQFLMNPKFSRIVLDMSMEDPKNVTAKEISDRLAKAGLTKEKLMGKIADPAARRGASTQGARIGLVNSTQQQSDEED